MPVTTFADIIFDPELFMEYMEEYSPNPSAFIQSGILRADPEIAARIANEGNIYSAPFYKPLTGQSQNYDGTDITVNKITSAKQTGVVIGRANAWGAQDLSAELASKDPMRSIVAKVATYWREERQRILIGQLNGVFGAASMVGHRVNIAIEDGNNATDANKLTAATIIDAAQSVLGDNASKITAIAVHSRVYANLLKQNLITFVPFSDQSVRVPTFLGYVLIVDDTLPIAAGGISGNKYTCYMMAPGVIGTAEGKVKVPVETARDSLKQGGNEWIVNRQRFTYHPYGLHFTQNSMATTSPDDAELATGTNWQLVYEPKNVPMAAVTVNG